YIHTNVIIFSYCLIFMASVTAVIYVVYRGVKAARGSKDGHGEYARVGGAGSLIVTGPDGSNTLKSERTTFGQVLDGTTMILMELSFVLLWAGIVMGAIWADHSWGRPWGWDPKEVFALNTFIIFAILIHTRMKVRDKGMWTAGLAIVGCVVMLFNWIVINFTISGLHSYAGG
ncbi:MAG: cytochrome c biogenesis protein CcsA, partial [Planctomycetota bacterium]